MRNKLFSFRTIGVAMIAVICGILAGCTKTVEFSVNFKSANAGYVVVDATVGTPTEVAYLCQETALPVEDPALINMSGTKVTFAKSGEQKLLADLKENTEYHLYLVARLSATEFSPVYVFTFTTGSFEFSQLATVVATMHDGFKMHITVPQSVAQSTPGTPGSRGIRYTLTDIMTYNLMRQNSDEYWMLLTNAGMHTTESTTLEFSDETNRMQSSEDLNEDGVVNEFDQTIKWNPVSPGEPIVFLAGEFEWMELPDEYKGEEAPNYVVDGWTYPAGWSAGYYLPMLDGEQYDKHYGLTKSVGMYDAIDITSPIDAMWTGAYQKKLFRALEPGKLDGKVDVEIVELGPVDATINFLPTDNVLFYSFCVLDDGTYGEMMKLLGQREELLQWATGSYFAMYNFGSLTAQGAAQLVLSSHYYDVPADTKYHVLVTGMGDELGTTQCFTHFTFNTPPKTKTKGPKIEVTALEDESSPYEAKFNIKCTSVADNPAVRCYYGANYKRDWIYAVNSGGTYLSYGQTNQFSSAELAKINSEEGLVISIPTIDGETTRLVVVGFNDENTPNDLNYEDILDCPAVADLTTPYYEAEFCPAYREMSSALAGDWTMSATVISGEDRVTLKKNVEILSEYTDYPSDITPEIMDVYHEHTKWNDDEIIAYYDEFLATAKAFNTKRLANQNKLMLMGWLDGGVDVAYQTMTPYDLFVSETISTVDVPSIFNDFGPKMFIEVTEENGQPKLSITADMYFGSPVMNWSDAFYMAGFADQESNNTIFYYADPTTGYYASPLVFDVELSNNNNTITIKPIVGTNGVTYYPNVIGQDSTTGRYLLNNPIVSEVVLTRGHSADAKSSVRKSSGKSVVAPATEALEIVHKPMTRLEKPVQMSKLEMDFVTVDQARSNMAEYLRTMHNNTK